MALVGGYLDNVLLLLDVHHAGEDELLTPLMIKRLPDQGDTIRGIAAQHEDITAPMVSGTDLLRAWQPTRPPRTPTRS